MGFWSPTWLSPPPPIAQFGQALGRVQTFSTFAWWRPYDLQCCRKVGTYTVVLSYRGNPDCILGQLLCYIVIYWSRLTAVLIYIGPNPLSYYILRHPHCRIVIYWGIPTVLLLYIGAAPLSYCCILEQPHGRIVVYWDNLTVIMLYIGGPQLSYCCILGSPTVIVYWENPTVIMYIGEPHCHIVVYWGSPTVVMLYIGGAPLSYILGAPLWYWHILEHPLVVMFYIGAAPLLYWHIWGQVHFHIVVDWSSPTVILLYIGDPAVVLS